MAGAANDVVWLDVLPSMRGFGPALTKGVEKDAGDAGKKAGGAMSGRMKLALVAGAAAVGAAFSAALVSNINIGKANDMLAAQLGLSAKESGRIGKVAGSLYRDAYGESIEQVNDAVASVMSSIDGMSTASSAELQSVTAKALDFAAAFEVDVSRAAQVAGQVVKTGLADTADEAFDLLVASSQKVPAALREDLLDAVDEYGPSFAQLGFSGEQAFGLLVDSSERGMYGIDKAGDALKEFTIRATDMSKASQDAYASIGLDAQTMSNDILAGGDKAASATQQVVDGLLAIEDPAAQGAAAIALFGTPLEDLGTDNIPSFLASLDGTSGSMADVAGAAEKMGDTLNDNFATRMESWKRNAMGFAQDGLMRIGDAGAVAFQWASEHKPAVTALGLALGVLTAGIVIYSSTVKIVTAVTKAWTVVQALLNGTMRLNPIGLLVTGLFLLGAALVLAYKKSETFRNIVNGAWAGIKIGLSVAWSFIQPIFAAVALWVGTHLPGIFNRFKAIAGSVFGFISSAINIMWQISKIPLGLMWMFIRDVLAPVFKWLWSNIIKPVFTWIGDKVAKVWNAVIKPKFQAIREGVGRIASAFTAAKDAIKRGWDKLGGVVSGPIDKAKGIINSFINLVNKIPGVNLPTLNGGGKQSSGKTAKRTSGRTMATGGGVHGPGTGTSDSIPTWLSNGEHVWTAKEVMMAGGQKAMYAMRAAVAAGKKIMDGPMAFAKGGAVVPGAGNRHATGYPWATWAGDFPNPAGTPVRAWKDGVIAMVRSLTYSYGKHMRMNHDDGTSSLYAHMSGFLKGVGDRVGQGTPIGLVGSTGKSSGNHLHFESMGGPFSGGSGVGGAISSIWDKVTGSVAGLTSWFKKNIASNLTGKVTDGGFFGKAGMKGMLGGIGGNIRDHVKGKIFDDGGMLMPGQAGLNLSTRPEPVFTGRQWDVLSQSISPRLDAPGAGGKTSRPIAVDGKTFAFLVEDIAREAAEIVFVENEGMAGQLTDQGVY